MHVEWLLLHQSFSFVSNSIHLIGTVIFGAFQNYFAKGKSNDFLNKLWNDLPRCHSVEPTFSYIYFFIAVKSLIYTAISKRVRLLKPFVCLNDIKINFSCPHFAVSTVPCRAALRSFLCDHIVCTFFYVNLFNDFCGIVLMFFPFFRRSRWQSAGAQLNINSFSKNREWKMNG